MISQEKVGMKSDGEVLDQNEVVVAKKTSNFSKKNVRLQFIDTILIFTHRSWQLFFFKILEGGTIADLREIMLNLGKT